MRGGTRPQPGWRTAGLARCASGAP